MPAMAMRMPPRIWSTPNRGGPGRGWRRCPQPRPAARANEWIMRGGVVLAGTAAGASSVYRTCAGLRRPTFSVPRWKTLGDATAAQLIARARAENPDIAALVARLAAARASAAAAAAARQPALTASSRANSVKTGSVLTEFALVPPSPKSSSARMPPGFGCGMCINRQHLFSRLAPPLQPS